MLLDDVARETDVWVEIRQLLPLQFRTESTRFGVSKDRASAFRGGFTPATRKKSLEVFLELFVEISGHYQRASQNS